MSELSGKNETPGINEQTLAEHLLPLLEQYDVKWRGYGIIYVDHESYNIETLQRILAGLSVSTGLSTPMIRSRLVELGWLNDVRNIQPVEKKVSLIVDSFSRPADGVYLEEEEIYRDESLD